MCKDDNGDIRKPVRTGIVQMVAARQVNERYCNVHNSPSQHKSIIFATTIRTLHGSVDLASNANITPCEVKHLNKTKSIV
jgi:hypothetical protein